MKSFVYISVIISVLLGSVAQIFLKYGTRKIGTLNFSYSEIVSLFWKIFTQPHILSGLVLYGISFIIWIFSISKLEISVAYPMLSIGFVFTSLFAYFFLGESLSFIQILGIFLIVLGTILITRV